MLYINKLYNFTSVNNSGLYMDTFLKTENTSFHREKNKHN